MYTKHNCGYCMRAKMWLMQNGYDYQEINIQADTDALAFMQGQGHLTVPQIYWRGEGGVDILVEGGFTGLNALSKSELDDLIRMKTIHSDLSSLGL